MAAVLSLKDQCDSDEKEEFSEILNLVSYEDSDDDEPKRKDKDCLISVLCQPFLSIASKCI